MPTLLVTGFEPFGEHASNPSADLLPLLAPSLPEGWNLRTRVLPVAWALVPVHLRQALSEDVEAVVSLGLASASTTIRIERVAINGTGDGLLDNRGAPPPNMQAHPDAPVGYYTTLPYAAIYADLRNRRIPCEYSWHAGVYLCNYLFFHLMHRIAGQKRDIQGGFIHLPPPGENTLSFDNLKNAVERIASITSFAARPRSVSHS